MSYVWNFLKELQKKKDKNSQQHIYLDIEQLPPQKKEEDIKEESKVIIIDLFSDEE
jgi:hypothetical protein